MSIIAKLRVIYTPLQLSYPPTLLFPYMIIVVVIFLCMGCWQETEVWEGDEGLESEEGVPYTVGGDESHRGGAI